MKNRGNIVFFAYSFGRDAVFKNCHVPDNGKEGGWEMIYENPNSITLPGNNVVSGTRVTVVIFVLHSDRDKDIYEKVRDKYYGSFSYLWEQN